MYNLNIAALLLGPLLGVLLMELGAPGPDVHQFGWPNGATVAFGAHVALAVLTYVLARRIFGRVSVPAADTTYSPPCYRRLALVVFGLNALQVAFVVFVVGAIGVLRGAIGKSEFRSQVGAFVGIGYLMRDFIIPLLAALVAAVYRRTRAGGFDRALLVANLLLCAFGGAIWGFKGGAVMIVLPALTVLLPRIGAVGAVSATGLAYAALTAFGMAFDRLSLTQSAAWIGVRASVGAGNVAWKIWDWQARGEVFPPYWPTLGSALGGRLAAFLGVWSRDDPTVAYQYDFTAMATQVAGDFELGVDVAASNVTSTVFGEAVIAFGAPGFLLMSVLVGLILAANRHWLDVGLAQARPLTAALAVTYFFASVWPWINAGGISVLFMIPFLAAYAFAGGIGWLALRTAGIAGPPLAPLPSPEAGVAEAPA